MTQLRDIYRVPLVLLTDLYQLTMAYGYWKLGRADETAVFHLFFRKLPFGGGYAIAAGLSQVVSLLRDFRFEQDDLNYLGSLRGNDDGPLFEQAFLDYLRDMEFSCDVDAMPEGTLVFANEPLVRIRGPILQAQLLETVLLNLVNFQTLIATKASRICHAAGDDAVLEFGLRRAQGIDGALTASRAAYLGGCAATSNVLAGKLFGIPVKGTHAHSWVMSFDDELESFKGYAQAMPNNCVFLVDTYDTLAGVEKAIEVGRMLRSKGYEMAGIRLDSGDLAYLSIQARKLLDDAGFQNAAVIASNDLDEHTIEDLKQQGAMIAVWGVGTKLATAYDQPALGGVYKLGAIQQNDGRWSHRIKLSEQLIKTSIPGMLQVRRFENEAGMVADMIHDELTPAGNARMIIDPRDATRRRKIDANASVRELLIPIARQGKVVVDDEPLEISRARARRELARLHSSSKRFSSPHEYPVGLEPKLNALRSSMIETARDQTMATHNA